MRDDKSTNRHSGPRLASRGAESCGRGRTLLGVSPVQNTRETQGLAWHSKRPLPTGHNGLRPKRQPISQETGQGALGHTAASRDRQHRRHRRHPQAGENPIQPGLRPVSASAHRLAGLSTVEPRPREEESQCPTAHDADTAVSATECTMALSA